MTAQLTMPGVPAGGVVRVATFSPDLHYRYTLDRHWDPDRPTATFVLLNPSTADDRKDDPTTAGLIRKCRRLGMGGFRIVNLFGYISTDPEALTRVFDPVGPGNDAAISRCAGVPGVTVVCGWGLGSRRGAGLRKMIRARGVHVLRLLGATPTHAFRTTADGNPAHPLFLPDAVTPVPWP